MLSRSIIISSLYNSEILTSFSKRHASTCGQIVWFLLAISSVEFVSELRSWEEKLDLTPPQENEISSDMCCSPCLPARKYHRVVFPSFWKGGESSWHSTPLSRDTSNPDDNSFKVTMDQIVMPRKSHAATSRCQLGFSWSSRMIRNETST